MSYNYIERYYGTRFEPGMRVLFSEYNNAPGIVKPARGNPHYVRVAFDDGHEGNCHPSSLKIEQPDFIYFECPECGFDSIQQSDFNGSYACPLCAGDSGHDVGMKSRIALHTDKPEGKDARRSLTGGQ